MADVDRAWAGERSATACTLGDDGVAWVTLNRPDAANARNQAMRDELAALWTQLAGDDDVKVVVLTGAGRPLLLRRHGPQGSAGEETLLQRRARMRQGRDIEALAHLPRPTIAAVNGYAMGGGLEMALACDLRVFADEAVVALPEVGHGLIPGGGGTVRLPRLIGPALAFEMLYTGRRVNGSEAVALGLANRSVPRAQLHDAAAELAAAIAQQPGHALREVKEAVLAGLDVPTAFAVEAERDRLVMLMDGLSRTGGS